MRFCSWLERACHELPSILTRSARFACVQILTLQFVLLPVMPYTWANEGMFSLFQPSSIDNFEDFSNSLTAPSAFDAQTRAEITSIQDSAHALENNHLPEGPDNLLHLANQRLELYRSAGEVQKFNLSQVNSSIPVVSVTNVRVFFDSENKELIFEGIAEGRVIARHCIPDFDIAAIAQSAEHLAIVDRQGRLHMIEMGHAMHQVFSGPIPVVENLWKAPQGAIEGQVSAQFITRGVKPISTEEEANLEHLIPRNADGQALYSAGDLIIRTQQGDENRLVGIFSRDVTYRKIIETYAFLCHLILLITPNDAGSKETLLILNQIAEIENHMNLVREKSKVTEADREALLTFGQNELLAIRERIQQITGPSASEVATNPYKSHPMGLMNRDRDVFYLEEWKTSFLEMTDRAIDLRKKLESELEAADKEKQEAYENLNRAIQEGDLSLYWQDFSLRHDIKLTAQTYQRSTFKKGLFALSAVAAGVAGASAFFPSEMILVANYIWTHHIPSVLKDAEYRGPLLGSMFSLSLLIPTIVLISSMTAPVLSGLTKMAKSGSRLEGRLRDIYNTWAPLSVWSRIVSAGMRVYSGMVYSVVNPLFKYLFRQPHFLRAIEEGLNPFTKISPDSDIGRLAGIEKPEFVGVSPFFINKQNKINASATKEALQTGLLLQNKKTETLAWLLAALAVGHESGVDPATLLTLAGGLHVEDLQQLLNDPKKVEEWQLVAEETKQHLQSLKAVKMSDEIAHLEKARLIEYYATARSIARKIQADGRLKRTARKLASKFRRSVRHSAKIGLSFGRKEADFLSSVFANNHVSKQVMQELVTYYGMMITIYGLHGPRADLQHPENLTATKDGFLYTSKAHWQDVSNILLGHFLVAGSNLALIFQGRAVVSDTLFSPIENFSLKSDDRVQGLLTGAFRWVKDLVDPRRSDLGGYMFERLKKRFTTLQANFWMSFCLRLAVAHQSLQHAFMAWLLAWVAGPWVFGYVRDVVQTGNYLQEEYISQMRTQMEQAKKNISQGARGVWGQEQSDKLLTEGKTSLIQLYEKHNPNALRLLVEKLRLNHANEIDALTLLEWSLKHPPVYTHANPSVSWFSTWAGAVWSMVLAVPLSVATFQPEKLTLSHISEWVLISASIYAGMYFLLGQNSWAFYTRKIEAVKDRIEKMREARYARLNEKSRGRRSPLKPLEFNGDSIALSNRQPASILPRSCQSVFR